MNTSSVQVYVKSEQRPKLLWVRWEIFPRSKIQGERVGTEGPKLGQRVIEIPVWSDLAVRPQKLTTAP